MIFKSDKNTKARYEKYKQSLRINNMGIIHDTVTHCISLTNKGISCALVIDSMEDMQEVYGILQGQLSNCNFKKLSNGEGGTLLDNGAMIRIFTINNVYSIPMIMGVDVVILHVKDGDPRAKRAREVLDL